MLGEGDCIDGRYRIYGEKGKGGGGIVYLAEHLALKKQVVLKQIINGSPDMELLRTEVDILKRLRHPALPQVYDFVNVNGNVFTVMEYIEGYNLQEYLDAGASHVIVTSYVFREGRIRWDRLEQLLQVTGREHLVLDLSCRKREDGAYYIVTDRWQTFTDEKLTSELMGKLGAYCDEFLIHGVDVEGKSAGAPEELVSILASCEGRPITYAGGIGTMEDLERFRVQSGGKLDFTIGSALDLFGGKVAYDVVKNYH